MRTERAGQQSRCLMMFQHVRAIETARSRRLTTADGGSPLPFRSRSRTRPARDIEPVIAMVPIESVTVMQPDDGSTPEAVSRYRELLGDKLPLRPLRRLDFYGAFLELELAVCLATGDDCLLRQRPADDRLDQPRLTSQSATRTCKVRGPCTPSTRISSMSLVAEGPEISVCVRDGARRRSASARSAAICPARRMTKWKSGIRLRARRRDRSRLP
jgi:hypothetical protein